MKRFRRASVGIAMVATGQKHVEEALETMTINRRVVDSLPSTVYTDQPDSFRGLSDVVAVAMAECRYNYRDKVAALAELPYEKTLFLDTDARVVGAVDDLFQILDYYDFCGSYAPVRWAQWKDHEVPDGLPEINSGVMGFRRNRRTRKLVESWLKIYDSVGVAFDQAALRSALWKSVCMHGLRIHILPPEYNLRTTKPWIAGLGMSTRIIHGRISNNTLSDLKTYLNTDVSRFRDYSQFPTGQNAHPAEWPAKNCKRWFVTGAGRSGTSLVTGLFRHTGFDLGIDSYLKRSTNPTGFFEDREVNSLNELILTASCKHTPMGEGQGWLRELDEDYELTCSTKLEQQIDQCLSGKATLFKDPRFCYTLKFWIESAMRQDPNSDIRIICVFRDPRAVVNSMMKEIATADYLQGIQLSETELYSAWCAQYRFFIKHYSSSFPCLFVHYDDIIDGQGIDRVEAFTQCELDTSLIQKRLRRSRVVGTAFPESARILYNELLAKRR